MTPQLLVRNVAFCWYVGDCSEWEMNNMERGVNVGKIFTCTLGLKLRIVIFNDACLQHKIRRDSKNFARDRLVSSCNSLFWNSWRGQIVSLATIFSEIKNSGKHSLANFCACSYEDLKTEQLKLKQP